MGKNRDSSSVDFGIRVGAVVARDDELLLVRHQKPERPPYWVLPGGRLEPGETIPECAEREVEEETGLSTRFVGVLYVGEYLSEGRHTVDIVARMETDGGTEVRLGSDPEVAVGSEPTLREARWVGIGGLVAIELLPTSVRQRLLAEAPSGWRAGEVYLGGGAD